MEEQRIGLQTKQKEISFAIFTKVLADFSIKKYHIHLYKRLTSTHVIKTYFLSSKPIKPNIIPKSSSTKLVMIPILYLLQPNLLYRALVTSHYFFFVFIWTENLQRAWINSAFEAVSNENYKEDKIIWGQHNKEKENDYNLFPPTPTSGKTKCKFIAVSLSLVAYIN